MTGAVAPGSYASTALSARQKAFLRRLATVLALVALAEAIAVVRLATLGDRRFSFEPIISTIAFLGAITLFALVGALIVQRRPATKVAWVMIAIGVSLGLGLAGSGYGTVGMPPRAPLPGALFVLIASQLFFVPSLATGSMLLFLLFPTDRLLSPRWQAVLIIGLVGTAIYVAASMSQPGPLDSANFPGVPNPIALPAAWATVSQAGVIVGNTLQIAAVALGALSLVLRYRQGDRIERAQIRWIALFGSVAAVAFAIAVPQLGAISDIAWQTGFFFLACLPIAIGIAITRYHLYDIDRLINRALVYGSLTAILAGVFTAGIGLAQRLFIATTGQSSDAAVVGVTLVAATIYAPLRKRLESVVDRRFKYGQLRFGAYRDEVLKILSILEPGRAAQRLVDEAVRELEATGGAVLSRDGVATATAGGWPVQPIVRLAIAGGNDVAATVVLGPRADGQPHDPPTVAQLEEIATFVGSAIRLEAANRPHTGR